ncbi:putative reverse transcriptase domain-containing protein [Tanacetum coccineum]
MMTKKYCPRGEIKKLEVEMWNLKSRTIEKYVGGLPDMIHESVMASKPKTMQDAIKFATELMDKKIRTFVERHSENKRKQDDNQQQQQNKRDCPKLKNNIRGNQGENGNAPAKVYAVGRAGTNPDSNIVTGTFLLNNRYASVLFDTGADRSFVSTAFSSQIDITPSTLRFIIMSRENRSYSLGNETLIVRGDESDRGNETHLNIISCTKTQKYMLKGCPIFWAHVTTKKTEDKSEKKRLEDVPIFRDFPEVFPEDLSSLLPTRQVVFQIDLILGDAPLAWAPYRLAPSEMKELSDQLQELSVKGFIRPSSSP